MSNTECTDVCSDTDQKIYRIKVLHSSETELYDCPDGMALQPDDVVIIPTRYGKDLGRVLGPVCCISEDDKNSIQKVIRIADEHDLENYSSNIEKEKEAVRICKEKVEARKLEMKLVSAHYITEESKVLFFFTAENRVDFRELVKDLVAVFKMRIELRQIGVRDESRVVGGLGVCGRAYCCHGVTDKLKPVSIKMAKEQNLSLNSMKISGPCGRLLCCLSYEYEFYKSAKKNLPSEGSKVMLGKNQYKITEINILTRIVKIIDSDGKYVDIPLSDLHYDTSRDTWVAEDS